MTYYEDDSVVLDVRIRMEGDKIDDNSKGDYVNLRDENGAGERCNHFGCCWGLGGSVFWYWVKLVVTFAFFGLLAAACVEWVGPFLMDKEIIPIINWETTTFSTPVLVVLLFASVALFPTLLLPSSPSMWVAGMTFGYGFGFLLIITAAAVGVSLPYFIGSLFLHKIRRWFDKYPKRAAILRAAGEGNWFHQFRAVALIRISPFPYIRYNYCAVATNVKYGPYFLGSLAGMVPEIFVAIYTGIVIRTLADASNDRHALSAPQIVFTVFGFCATVVATIIITVYAKRQLKVMQDEPLLA
ncbi:PREDICTED: transmembrane protein 64-like [Populus euphratica]|uniref:Transmembrane protein 64-like n=1 Tax=Populus euphratica TaxID=75702 RepID=A0AAJ6UG60_POPEU|nr:PREDICTED: transmembrane protein 64-like [Populus euphratica]